MAVPLVRPLVDESSVLCQLVPMVRLVSVVLIAPESIVGHTVETV